MSAVTRLLEKIKGIRATNETSIDKGEQGRLRHHSATFLIAPILAMMGSALVITGCEAPQQTGAKAQVQRREVVTKEVEKSVIMYPDLIVGTPYQVSDVVPLAKTCNGVPTETLVKNGFFRVLNVACPSDKSLWYEVMVSNGNTDYHMWINACDLNGMTVASRKSEEQQWLRDKAEQERAWRQYADQQEEIATREAERQREAELNKQMIDYQAQRAAQVAEMQNFQAMQIWRAQQEMQRQMADLNSRMQSSQREQNIQMEKMQSSQKERNAQMEKMQREQIEREKVAVQIQDLERSRRESRSKGYSDGSIQQRQIDDLKSRYKLP